MQARQFYESEFATALAASNSIHMIHESYLLKLMNWFWAVISGAEESYSCFADIKAEEESIHAMFIRTVRGILKQER